MNIAQAKEELINTVKTYLAKDKDGCYRIPRVRQRPILLMGPPGIGKTAIMEQVARRSEDVKFFPCLFECGFWLL